MVKLRKSTEQRRGLRVERFFLSVPRELAVLIPEEQQFDVRLTPEGILFAPASPPEPPAWT